MVSRATLSNNRKERFQIRRGFGTSITIKAYRPTTEEEIFKYEKLRRRWAANTLRQAIIFTRHGTRSLPAQLSKRQIMPGDESFGTYTVNFKPCWSQKCTLWGLY